MHSGNEVIYSGLEIAVIGMDCKFPGANSINEFWENLKNGRESISFFSEDELIAMGIDPELVKNPSYVKAKGAIEDIDLFDATFFEYTTREAELMDPQLKLLHHTAWAALEHSGYNPEYFKGLIGVYVGAAFNWSWASQFTNKKYSPSEFLNLVTLNDISSFSTLLSYKFNLNGASVSVNTACSSSLVAIHMALKALQNSECDIALAGGVSVTLPQKKGYLYQENMICSPDGHCRTFDMGAQGTVFGDGAGIVVLKRLEDAINDRDTIYAVVKDSAVNNDGRRKVGFTASSLKGQYEVIKMAHILADVKSESIEYVEAHGTATPLGDPVEFKALKDAFNTDRKNFCGIGSVKTNIGHLDAAAGVAGFIKTVLSLYHKLLVPSINFSRENPRLNIIDSPFYVVDCLKNWNSSIYPRRAAVSAFGIGGTNVHTVLEEAPINSEHGCESKIRLMVLSAKTETALQKLTERFYEFINRKSDINLSDMVYTLCLGRKELSCRKYITYANKEDLLIKLSENNSDNTALLHSNTGNTPIVMLFTGSDKIPGDFHKSLYESDSSFRVDVDNCLNIINMISGSELFDSNVLFFEDDKIFAGHFGEIRLKLRTFVFGYSFASLLIRWGVKVNALVDLGRNEYLSACLSGVLPLKTSLTLLMMKLYKQNKYNSEYSNMVQGLEINLFGGTLNKPNIPFISLSDNTWANNNDALDIDYWINTIDNNSVSENIGDDIYKLVFDNTQTLILEIGAYIDKLHDLYLKLENKGHKIISTLNYSNDTLENGTILSNIIGRLWINGAVIDWPSLFEKIKGRRIPLPNYPFEGQIYSTKATWDNANDRNFIKKFEDPNEWFYYPLWKQANPLRQYDTEMDTSQKWLVFVNQHRIGDRIKQKFDDLSIDVTYVFIRNTYGFEGVNNYFIDPNNKNDYSRMLKDLKLKNKLPDKIIHMWNLPDEPDVGFDLSMIDADMHEYLNKGFYSIIHTVLALSETDKTKSADIFLISDEIFRVNGNEKLQPHKSLISGLSKVIPQEYPDFNLSLIDISVKDEEEHIAYIIDKLIDEFNAKETYSVIAYRGCQGFIPDYEKIVLLEPDLSKKMPLRTRGVYVITGGLGKIGLVLAGYLSRNTQATIVLLGRRAFPARNDWNNYLIHTRNDSDTSRVIKEVLEIESHGGRVEIFDCDISCYDSTKTVFDKIYKNVGEINGIIHAAGITSKGAFASMDDADFSTIEEQFKAKVSGTMNLARIIENKKIDFCILMSSISTIIGGIGYSSYASANSFLDCFTNWAEKNLSIPFICIDWDGWNLQYDVEKSPVNSSGLTMTEEEGTWVFERILACRGLRKLVVSTADINKRINYWVYSKGFKSLRSEIEAEGLAPVSELSSENIEKILLDIWKEQFGIQNLSSSDNFYEMGGDSLTAASMLSKIFMRLHVQIKLQDFFKQPSIKGLAKLIKNHDKTDYGFIKPAGYKEFYKLSSAQKRFFILHQINEDSIMFNETQAAILQGDLDIDRLKNTLNEIVRRNECFRTSFILVDDEPMQRISKDVQLDVRIINHYNGSIEGFVKDFVRPFDIQTAPLVRVALLKMKQNEYCLVTDMHHIITDGISHELFIKEFTQRYEGISFEEPTIQYKDYAEWQNSQNYREIMQTKGNYWLNVLGGTIPKTNLLYDYKRPDIRIYKGETLYFEVNACLSEAVRNLSRNYGLTIFNILLGTFIILLSKYTGQDDIIVGSPVSGRRNEEIRNVMGMFVNMLALRNFPQNHKSAIDFLAEVNENTLKAFENQDYQFDELVAKLSCQGNVNRNPLFDVVFSLHNIAQKDFTMGDIKVIPHNIRKNESQFDLLVIATDYGATISLTMEYSCELFRRSTVEAMMKHYIEILGILTSNNNIKIGDIYLSTNYEEINAADAIEPGDFIF